MAGFVIVGAGECGARAAFALREKGFDGTITLIGNETHPPYERPPLSKEVMLSGAGPKLVAAVERYAEARIDLLLGRTALEIDRAGKCVLLADGTAIPYDRLLLATGARPRPLPGVVHGGRVVTLRTHDDAMHIREYLAKGKHVAILGGGFIGLEIAATMRAAGRRVTVVEAVDRLLGRAVAPVIASHVRQRLAEIGVRVLTGTTVARLEGENGHVVAAVTSTGERLPAGMVIIGVGVVPNVELAGTAGIATANGIRVDQQMRTSAPGVLAIGDAASYRHWFTGADVRLESVQNATDHARLAARTILGHDDSYSAVPWFWSDIGDMKLQMVGLALGGDHHVVAGDAAENKFSVYHYAGDRLIAVESVNRPADHMLGRKMLGAGFSPAPGLVAGGPDALKAALAAFQQESPSAAAG